MVRGRGALDGARSQGELADSYRKLRLSVDARRLSAGSRDVSRPILAHPPSHHRDDQVIADHMECAGRCLDAVGPIKISNISGYDASEMTFAQDGHVVQAFAPQTAQEPLAVRVGTRRSHRRFQDPNLRPIDHMPKLRATLLVVIPNEKARAVSRSSVVRSRNTR